MNVWRGTVRLWIFASAIWIAIVAAVHWDEIRAPHLQTKYFVLTETLDLLELRRLSFNQTEYPHHNQLDFPNHVTVFSDTKIVRDTLDQWARSFVQTEAAKREQEISNKRGEILKFAALLAFLPCIFLILLGVGLRWVINGFRR